MQMVFNKTVLDNGLTVISEYVPGVRSISAGVWIHAGSRDETPFNMGVAHFLEHMVFKGTFHFSAEKIATLLEESGGSLNAYTTKEYTVFYSHTLDTELSKSIRVLADMVCRPSLDGDEFVREKQVVLEEINAVRDTPEEYIFDVFQETLFPDQALGFPIAGTESSIAKLEHKQLKDFWRKHYTADNMVLSVAGNVEHSKLVRLADRYFQFQSSVKTSLEPTTSQPAHRVTTLRDAVNQCHICTGVGAVSYQSPFRYPLIALSTYLGGGMSSRLFQLIRERHGLAYSVYSFIDFYRDCGSFGIYLATDVRQEQKVLALLKKELVKLTQKPLSSGKLDNLKKQLHGGILLALESTRRRMSRIAKNELWFGRQLEVDETIAEIDGMTSASIQETARMLFENDLFNQVIIKPNA